MTVAPFADRLAAAVVDRRSQLCLGLDPDPGRPDGVEPDSTVDSAAAAADRVAATCARLIEAAAPSCVAVKLQLACFERLGGPGWTAMERVGTDARSAGLLVIADGKRGDVPVTAAAYAEAMFGGTATRWGHVPGLGADAATINPLLGSDSMEPLIEMARQSGAGVFALVRSSNPGAADLLDVPAPDRPLFERLAAMVTDRAELLAGKSGLSGMGAVVGATKPQHLGRLRELMPSSIFLVPGVGAQGGRVADLGAAAGPHPASVLVTVSRSLAQAPDPARAARDLRTELWDILGN